MVRLRLPIAVTVAALVVALAGCGAQVPSVAGPSPSGSPAATWSFGPSLTFAPTPTLGPTFPPIDLFATPTPPPAGGGLPTDQVDSPAPRRPVPVQSAEWLALKAAGRVSLQQGRVVILDAGVNPLIVPATGALVPSARTLETDYARWIIEPLAYGRDARGNEFDNDNYWYLCEPGATAAALYYWELRTGYPSVTRTEGWFLDPYEAEGVAWPSPGPSIVWSGGKRLGTYWTGTDHVNGYTAHGRGYIMYLSMQVQPPGWQSKGIPVYAEAGRPLYPTIGAPRTNIQVALNWEASGHDGSGWSEFWYAGVMRFEPTLARDLQMAVTLDVGRDGVPVVVELDTHGLPDWSQTRHVRHAVTIVGYDNTANPPTYTYIDTCGKACNGLPGNQNGKLHRISQDQMVRAIQDRDGSGFVW